MAHFLDLPPEIRQSIYDALLVDPIRERSRLVCTVDASGESSWSRTTAHMRTEQRVYYRRSEPVKPSVSHIDYSDLWSLASVNKMLYLEATPTMYMDAQLGYIPGDMPSTDKSPTLLHTYLQKISSATSMLYHNLTIRYGSRKHLYLSAKDMKVLVDLINLRLSNLLSLGIRAVTPSTQAWYRCRMFYLFRELLRTLAAARLVACLTSRPYISFSPRGRLRIAIERSGGILNFSNMNDLTMSRIWRVKRSIVGIRDWRRKAQDYHANACLQGDYLLLTSFLRSTSAGAGETDALKILDDMEDGLAKHQEVLSLIKEHETLRIQEIKDLRKLRRLLR
jgi:hypothetical protein